MDRKNSVMVQRERKLIGTFRLQLYSFLAEYLTELELHRTQTSFDDSITLKMYLLQFVNYYSSIFYIAFFKGKFTGSPKKYTPLFGYRQEEVINGVAITAIRSETNY